MKTLKTLPIVAALASAGLLALSTPSFAGIADTKHNLGTSTNAGTSARTFSGTGEICVFCHTPHGSDTSASVPLWNRKLAASSTYTTYDDLATSTLDGTVTSVGSVSIACLSCHDGTQAMDVVLNAPGSGGYDATGATMDSAGTWSDSNSIPQGIANLGADLRNDHPVGIQYAGGGLNAGTLTAANANDTDFKDIATTTVNTQAVFWVDADADGTREKTEMQLYTRDIGSGDEPFVECASCHDPHVSGTATFLRINNTGSAVCLACHTK